jgi:hypothetical protein
MSVPGRSEVGKNVATGSLLATAFVLVFLRAICLIKKGTNKD